MSSSTNSPALTVTPLPVSEVSSANIVTQPRSKYPPGIEQIIKAQPTSRYPPGVGQIIDSLPISGSSSEVPQSRRAQQKSKPPTTNPQITRTQSPTRLPPGIEQIIDNSDGSSSGSGWSIGPVMGYNASQSSLNDRRARPETRGLSTQELATMSEVSELIRTKNKDYSPQALAVRNIQAVNQSLRQIRDGLYLTIREYFSSKIMINWLEVPAYRPLHKALDQLISTLDSFAINICDRSNYNNTADIESTMCSVQEVLTHVLGEGERLLAVWNRRDTGQVVGQPLTGKSWRLRRIVIHSSNEQLENVTRMANIADAKIREEQASKHPSVNANIKHGKVLEWMKHIGAVGGRSRTLDGSRNERPHSGEDGMTWRLRSRPQSRV